MSIESVAIALHHSRARGTAKLVLIGIANHDGDGGAWPSVATLAKYAGVTPRNVQKALRELEALGEIRTHRQAGGVAEMPSFERPNRYDFLLCCPDGCDRTTKHREAPPVGSDTRGASDATGGGVSDATPKPSLEPPVEPSNELEWPAPCAGDEKTTSFQDWRSEDLDLFRSLIDGDAIYTDGTEWQPEGRHSIETFYRAFRKRQSGTPMQWPGRYFERISENEGVENYLMAHGLEAVE